MSVDTTNRRTVTKTRVSKGRETEAKKLEENIDQRLRIIESNT